MNTWIYKMVAWHRRFAAATGLKRAPVRESGHLYWSRGSRTWGAMRQRGYVLVVRTGAAPEFNVRRRW
jgi:hypothetical protein